METTGDPTPIELTPDRTTINADGEDVSGHYRFRGSTRNTASVPVAPNQIHFALRARAKFIGVGNGDPSCHEPDVFVPQSPARNVAVDEGWRWKKLATIVRRTGAPSGIRTDFDDPAWKTISGGGPTIETPETDGDLSARTSG